MNYHSAGPDENALRLAFKKCGELAEKGGYSQVALAIPTKGNLDGLISKVIGEDATSLLQRNNKLDLKGLTVHLITERITPRNFRGPVLAAYTTLGHLKELMKSRCATDIVFVPWAEEELTTYLLFCKSQEI